MSKTQEKQINAAKSAANSSEIEAKIGKLTVINKALSYGNNLSTDYSVTLDKQDNLKLHFTVKIGGAYLDQVLKYFLENQFHNEKPKIQGFSTAKVPPYMVLVDHYANKFKKGTYQHANNLFDYVLITEIRRAIDILKDEYALGATLDPIFEFLAARPDAGNEKTSYQYADYEFKFAIEIMPQVPELDLSKLTVDGPKAEVLDSEVMKNMEEWAAANYTSVPLK